MPEGRSTKKTARKRSSSKGTKKTAAKKKTTTKSSAKKTSTARKNVAKKSAKKAAKKVAKKSTRKTAAKKSTAKKTAKKAAKKSVRKSSAKRTSSSPSSRAPRKSSSPQRKSRNKPLTRRPTLAEALRNADRVARSRANRRIARGRGHRTVQASLNVPLPEIGDIDLEILDEPEEPVLSPATIWVRRFIGLLILFPCFIAAITLFQQVSDQNFLNTFWQKPEFFCFTVGATVCTISLIFASIRRFWLYLYVLGHELTHVLFIFCCFGSVSGFSVTPDGGYVITNKTNVLIALSPYFVPFWSLVSLAIVGPLYRFVPDLPAGREVLFATLGATWTFHLLFTCWMIPRDQPDLQENESFFSFNLILLANILLFSGIICWASTDLGWRDFVYNWYNNSLELLWEPFKYRILPRL